MCQKPVHTLMDAEAQVYVEVLPHQQSVLWQVQGSNQ
jgi:hypothetical protein